MSLLPGDPPAPSFDHPLEMLRACHGRIRAQCATLRKLHRHLPRHCCDAQARQAAQAILRYFDTAGRHHHGDEEQDLFPALLATSSDEARDLVSRLLHEHEGMEAAWQRLHPLLKEIADGNAATLGEGTVEDFIGAYERHIELENGSLLPLAARLLEPASLEVIGRNMAARRGASFPP